jgi:hypothetical protein
MGKANFANVDEYISAQPEVALRSSIGEHGELTFYIDAF